METRNLTSALCDSITNEAASAASNILEAGLDSILEDGSLKDIPLLSTAISIYRIGHSINERHYIKKLAAFIQAFNEGLVEDSQVEMLRNRISYDSRKSVKELEYVLVLVDRYIGYEKPKMIAKLYLAYLKSKLSWEEFSMYSEVTDQLFVTDLEFLRKAENQIIPEVSSDAALRLTSMGLLFEVRESPEFNVNPEDGHLYCKTDAQRNEKIFSRTMFGTKYIEKIDSKIHELT